MRYKNVVVLGTSHIAQQSINEVEQWVEKEQPGIIALELDKRRYYALLHPQKRSVRLADMRRIGIKGFIFSLIGAWAEKKLGEWVHVKPGSEMKKAMQIAKKRKLKLALIDQDIEVTLKKFSKGLSWKEKWNFLADIAKAVLSRKKEFEFDLRKVPSEKLIAKMMSKIRKRYPNIFRVLITERNDIMAKNLANLMMANSNEIILALVGAGHKTEVLRLIKKYYDKNKIIIYSQKHELSYGSPQLL